MRETGSATERFWMRLPKKVIREIEDRAMSAKQSKTDWVRDAILEALSPKPDLDYAVMDSIREMRAHQDRQEARSYHETSALIHLMLIMLRETTHASTGAIAAASLAGGTDTRTMRGLVLEEAQAEFEKIHDEALSDVSDLRANARILARRQGDSEEGLS